MSGDWTIRDAVPEDEGCLASMWLKGYAHAAELRDCGFDNVGVDGHPDEIRYWKVFQPIVTALIRMGNIKVACDPDRATYGDKPAVIAGWACTSPGYVHWVGIKRNISKVPGAAADLCLELLGADFETREHRFSFELMDLRREGLIPKSWSRDRGWLASLRSMSMRVLDRDDTYQAVGSFLLNPKRDEWLSNSERAALAGRAA